MKKNGLVIVVVVLALLSITTFINAQNNTNQDTYKLVVEVEDDECTWEKEGHTSSGTVTKLAGIESDAAKWVVKCRGHIVLPADIDIQNKQTIKSTDKNPLGTCILKPYNLVTNEWKVVYQKNEKSKVTCKGHKDSNPYPYPAPATETPGSNPYPYPVPATETPNSNPYPYPGPATETPDSNPYPGPATETPDSNPYPGPATETPIPPPATDTPDPYPYPGPATNTPTPSPSPSPSPVPPSPTATPNIYP